MTFLGPALLAWMSLVQAAPPEDGAPLAWIRFADVPEAETYAGTRYLWLGRAETRLIVEP